MTELEWLTCDDPVRMGGFLSQLAGDRRLVCHLTGPVLKRKVRLFACACCRRGWGLLADGRSRRAVEVAERHADGLTNGRELRQAHRDAQAASGGATNETRWLAAEATRALGSRLWPGAWFVPSTVPAALLRCVFGNPFRPPAVDRASCGWDVIALARAAYEERGLPGGELDTHRLAVLADAVEEAGRADEALLGHLRSPGPHIRGCWAVDLLLSRE